MFHDPLTQNKLKIADTLYELLGTRRSLLMMQYEDGMFHGSLSKGDGRPGSKQASSRDLLAFLQRLVGKVDSKKCLGPCATDKPLDCYADDCNSTDGKLARCLVCEASRVQAWSRGKDSVAGA